MQRQKSKKHKKIKVTSVQAVFNKAIVERDGKCIICGRSEGVQLQCSHFFPVGSHQGLRFYPDNAYCMCAGCHISHHQRNPYLFVKWFENNRPEILKFLDTVKNRPLKYSQVVLSIILKTIKTSDLQGLKDYINRERQRLYLEGIFEETTGSKV